MPRALVMMPIPIGIAILEHYDKLGSVDVQYDNITLPFAVILSLLMAFRIGDAFRKWQSADDLVLNMHGASREAVAKMCAFLPMGDPEAEAACFEVRRLIVLGCLLIKQHILDEKSNLEDEGA